MPDLSAIYPPEVAEEVCRRLANGQTLREIAKAEGMPAPSTVIGWAKGDYPPIPDFPERYMRAREIGWEVMAEDLIEISDNGTNDWMETNDPENPGYRVNGEHQARSRLRTDNRKWLLSKRLAGIFGDKMTNANQQLDKNGQPMDPVVPVVQVTFSDG
jgi:transcriptional regulator with XRE-family HTH domain